MHHTEWLYSVFGTQYSVRRWDPTCRLRGWRTLAAEIDRQRAELRQRGIEPVIAASGWSLPGEIGFYCSGHPHVYSFALAGGGRHSQYDLWRPNPTNDPDAFRGRTVIYIGEITPTIRAAFHHVELTRWITHRVSGHVVATWPITVCVGFTGFTGFQFGGGY
jgi:hypothetical protein